MFATKKYGISRRKIEGYKLDKSVDDLRIWCTQNKQNLRITTIIRALDSVVSNIDYDKMIALIEDTGMDEEELDLNDDSIQTILEPHGENCFISGLEKIPVNPQPTLNDRLIEKMTMKREGHKLVGNSGGKNYKDAGYESTFKNYEKFKPHEESCRVDKGGSFTYGYGKAVVTSKIDVINDYIIDRDRKVVTELICENANHVVEKFLKKEGVKQGSPKIEYTAEGLNKVKSCFNLQAPIILIKREKLSVINESRIRNNLHPIKPLSEREFLCESKNFYKHHKFSRSEQKRFNK